jgi:hypothetical protein
MMLLFMCATTAARAQSGTLWRPDDRVLITDFSQILSLARDNSTLYGVTPYGLLQFDLSSRRFKLPLTIEDGYPARERPLAVAYAPSSFTVFLGTAQGTVYTVNTLAGRFDDVAHLPGSVLQIIAPAGSFDIYAGSPQSWYRLRSGSYFPEPVQGAPGVQLPGANDPYLRSMIGTAGSAQGRFPAEVSALETDRTNATYFAGTRGNGIVELNTRTTERTRLPYGLNTRGAGAVAAWRGRIWFGGDTRTSLGSVVSATTTLDDFRDNLPNSGAPSDIVVSMLATDSALWVGTVNGLFALSGPPGRERWQSYARAVPGQVSSIATAGAFVFAGTDRGVTRVSPGGTTDPVLTGRIVYGLAPVGDTLWIASEVGVAALKLSTAASPAVALRGGGSPDVPVYDVRQAGDTLYAVTADALYRRGPQGWVEPDRAMASRLGPFGRLRTDGADVWLLGSRGFAVKGARSAAWVYYMDTDDIPEAPVRDLLPLGETVWLATPAGALRVRKPR